MLIKICVYILTHQPRLSRIEIIFTFTVTNLTLITIPVFVQTTQQPRPSRIEITFFLHNNYPYIHLYKLQNSQDCQRIEIIFPFTITNLILITIPVFIQTIQQPRVSHIQITFPFTISNLIFTFTTYKPAKTVNVYKSPPP